MASSSSVVNEPRAELDPHQDQLDKQDKQDHHIKNIYVREIGPPPEDPVCDSGIYCYGKKLTLFNARVKVGVEHMLATTQSQILLIYDPWLPKRIFSF